MKHRFRVYYGDGTVVEGRDGDDWQKAPDEGVQVVVQFPRTQPRKWTGIEDRDLWTGTDNYDPFGWGVKAGSLLPDSEYFAIWGRACGDPCP